MKEANRKLRKVNIFNERKDYSFTKRRKYSGSHISLENTVDMMGDYSSSLLNLNFNNIERSIVGQHYEPTKPIEKYSESENYPNHSDQEFMDRTVKFNPFVHNIYFSDKSNHLFENNSSNLKFLD